MAKSKLSVSQSGPVKVEKMPTEAKTPKKHRKKRPSNVSEAEVAELKRMAAVANSRIARATPGQRRELEHWTHGRYFSKAIPESRAEYNVRIAALHRFIKAESTTRKGWKAIKTKAVIAARKTLGDMGYDLTDDELATILAEIHSTEDKKDFYRILDIVQAVKWESEALDSNFAINRAIAEATTEKVTSAEAISRKMQARKMKEQVEKV